jgi:hypothetical protein
MKGYRLTLTFAIASAFFAVTYVLTVDRVVVAGIFVALLSAVMLVDMRVQHSRRGEVSDAEAPSASQDRAEHQTLQSTAVAEPVAKQSQSAVDADIPGPASSAPVVTGFSQALLKERESKLEESPIQGLAAPQTDGTGLATSAGKSSSAMACSDWMQVIRTEYLHDFVKNAGAAIKFVIPQEPGQHQVLWSELEEVSHENDYLFVRLDAATTRVHLVDELFYEIARQVDWDGLALDFLFKTLADGKYLAHSDKSQFSLSQVAAMNGLDLGEMRAIINNRLRDNLSRYFEMTDDFRMAMLKLCQAQLDPQDLGVGAAEAVREWLRGDLKLISALKSASIFEKIGRSNGRDMVSSLAHWLHLTGKSGLVLGLDISRFLVAKRHGQPDGSLYYSSASVLDGYEALRQFVDSTDELQYCLIVVLAPPTFLSDEQRGVRKYDALYLRIWDEVHDRQAVNPLSTVVRISGQENSAPQGLGIKS